MRFFTPYFTNETYETLFISFHSLLKMLMYPSCLSRYCDMYGSGTEQGNAEEMGKPTPDSNWGWCSRFVIT